MSRFSVLLMVLSAPCGAAETAGYVGSQACKDCHARQFESQSKTGHARALVRAAPGSVGEWAVGAGLKAITRVSQAGEDAYVEHGLSYYSATKSMALTPGHTNSGDVRYRTFDPDGTALRCFRCHSTGPLSLTLLRESGQKAASLPILRRALSIYEAAFGADSPQTRQTRRDLGIVSP